MEKICIFGDSIAKGIVLDPLRMKYILTDFGIGKYLEKSSGAEVLNYAKFGCTVTKGQTVFEKHKQEIDQSDTVILEFGGNDCDHTWGEIAENPEGTFDANTNLETFEAVYEEFTKRILSLGKKVVILTLPPIDAKKYFKWISTGKNSANIIKWLGSVDYIYRWHEMYNQSVCAVARKTGAMLIDLRSIFLKLRNYSDYLCDDGIHPNEAGYRLINNALGESCLMNL